MEDDNTILQDIEKRQPIAFTDPYLVYRLFRRLARRLDNTIEIIRDLNTRLSEVETKQRLAEGIYHIEEGEDIEDMVTQDEINRSTEFLKSIREGK